MSFIHKTLLQKGKLAKRTWGKLEQANPTGLIFIVISVAIFVLSSLWFFSKLLVNIPVNLENITGYQILTSPKSRIDMQLAPTDSKPSCFGSDCNQIVMEIQRINYAEHKIYGVFHIKIPYFAFLTLQKGNEGIVDIVENPVTQGNDLVFIDPETAKKNLIFQISYNLYPYSRAFFIRMPISLGEILNGLNEDYYYRFYETTIPFEIEIIGDTGLYPNDLYSVDLSASIYATDGISYTKRDEYTDGSLIPFNLNISLSPNMTGMIAKVYTRETPESAPAFADNYNDIAFEVCRDSSFLLYVYGMSVVPVFLTVLLFHRLFFNKRFRDKPEDNLLLEVAAVFLAILPLRSVLVPSEIEGTTRVDYILAYSITLLVSILLIRYGLDLINYLESKNNAATK